MDLRACSSGSSPSSLRVLFLSSVLLFVVSASLMSSSAHGGWTSERVDGPSFFHTRWLSNRSIAVDIVGDPHIVYGGDHLYHAWLKNGKWRREVLDGSNEVGGSAAIAIDHDGKIHIVYQDEGDQPGIKYITDRSGEWETFVVDGSEGYFSYISLAVDGGGKVHVSYFDGQSKDLRYATNSSGIWRSYPIDSRGDVGRYSSIATDSKNHVHIAYYDSYFNDLKYATNASGKWVTSTRDSIGIVGQGTSITVDSRDKVHISYTTYESDSALKYCSNATGSWRTEIVDSTEDVGDSTSIAVDSDNRVHISYHGAENGGLRYATDATEDHTWQVTVADGTGSVGYCSAIAVSGSDRVHVAYLDVTKHGVKYAAGDLGGFTMRTLDHSGQVGYSSSLAIDKEDKLHIAYTDDTGHNLKYATNASGTWKRYVIDSSGNVLFYVSIAVNGDGKVHIAYSQSEDLDVNVKYATNASGTWKYSFVDRIGDFGGGSHIAVDSNNKVHIAYGDTSNGDLKHATNATSLVTLQMEKTGTGTGMVTSSSGKIHCSPVCEGQFKKGTVEVLTAEAFKESVFTGWGGACSGLGKCTITMGNDKYVTAGFELIRPMSPSRLAALAMSGTVIDLTWKDNSNNESGFKIEGRKSDGGTYGVVGEVGPNVTTFSAGGLEPDVQYSFRVRAYNAKGLSSYSNEANAFTSLFIKLSCSNGGQYLMAGLTWRIGWTYSGNVGDRVKIDLLKGGAYYKTLASSWPVGEEGYGVYGWAIPWNETTGTDYKIRVTSTTNGSYTDDSNSNFKITPGISLLTPGGGEIWKAGGTYTIEWAYTAAGHQTVKIQLYRAGVPDVVISSATSRGNNGEGRYTWTIPADQTPFETYKLRVTSADNLFYDDSNYRFTITAP